VNRSCFLNLAAWRTRSTPVTRALASGSCFAGSRSPRPRPWLHRLRRRSTSGFVRRLPSYFGEVRLLGLVHHRLRLLAFPMRAGSAIRPNPRSPGSHTKSVRTCQGLRPRRTGRTLALSPPLVIAFHVKDRVCVRNKNHFRGSMAGLCVPCQRFAAALTDDCA